MVRTERKDLIKPYWNAHGGTGTMISEFIAVQRAPGQQQRAIDGVIVEDGKGRWLPNKGYDSDEIAGKEITVVQAKFGNLGMYLLGQALFSKELMKPFKPRCIRTIALCEDSDAVLAPLAKEYGIEVVCRSEFKSV